MSTATQHFQQMAALANLANLVERAYLEGYRQGARNTAEIQLPSPATLNREAEESWLASDARDELITEQGPAEP